MLKEIKQRQRHVLLDGIRQIGRSLVHDEVNGAIAEHRHPHQGKARRDKQHAGHELADGSAAGHTGNEHPDKRRPGQPPAPVQQRPASQPVAGFRFISVQVKRLAHQLGQVSAGIFHKGFQQEYGWPQAQHQHQQQYRQPQIEL